MKFPLLAMLAAIPALSLTAKKPTTAAEKCEWRKIRRYHPRQCVTPSGRVCPAERCNAEKSANSARP